MILDDILDHKRQEVAARMRTRGLSEVRAAAESAPPPRGFVEAPRRSRRDSELALIAEVKRRSPARGSLNEQVVPAQQALSYAGAGASAISVLTDHRFFGGSEADLRDVREAVDVPVLRKDFTIDEYQVWEARAMGADAVLLIVRALDQAHLADFQRLAWSLGMAALVEVHDEAELERAVAVEARLIGINNRDLSVMRVDLAVTRRLAPLAPAGACLISESGIASPDDVAAVAGLVDAILVGEALMSAGDPVAAVRRLLSGAGRAQLAPDSLAVGARE